MTDLVPVSAYLAGWVADTNKVKMKSPTSIAAREARKVQLRQEQDDVTEEDVERAAPALALSQATLDFLSHDDQRQESLQHVQDMYRENS